MINVFLAEDEKIIRDGIRRRIDWEGNGLCLAGEAGDWERAYEEILLVKPDILITDVTMPFRDGLELSEMVKRELPDIKIIIISGFDQFIFASRALKIGVTDYLMKPVDAKKLLVTLLRAKQEVEEEQSQKRYLQLLKQQMSEKEKMRREVFLGELILGKCRSGEILSKSRELHMDLSAKAYNLILFQYWRENRGQRSPVQDQQVEDGLLKLWENHKEALAFDRGMEGGAVLWKGMGESGSDRHIDSLVKELEGVFDSVQGIRYYISVGKEVRGLGSISECYHEANKAFAGRFFSPSGCADHVCPKGETAVRGRFSQEYDITKVDKERIQDFLRNGSRLEVEAFIEEYCIRMGIKNLQSFLFRQYVLMASSLGAICFVQKAGGDTVKLEDRFTDTECIAGSAATIELTKKYLFGLLDRCIEIRDGVKERGDQALLERGKEYMEEHYGDTDISLNKVASHVNVSPNHFSRLFSQQEKKTFVEYLTDIRMRHAREMLRCTGLKATEISRRLGYKDPHYFYYLFKKTVGCTPGDYRMKNVG